MDIKFSGDLKKSHITQRKRKLSLLLVIFRLLPKMLKKCFFINGREILCLFE